MTKDTNPNNSKRKPIHAHPAHMYNLFALHAQGRSAIPLPLSVGKQQARELTPSKIITITNNTYNYQRREVDGQWGRMEQSTQVSMGHTVITNNNTMEQSNNTCLWGITAFSLTIIHNNTINGTIQYHMPMGHNNI